LYHIIGGDAEMSLTPFTRNYADNSTESGFQFTFFCDRCNSGTKTNFTPSKSYKKAGFLRGLGRAASIGSSVLGGSAGYHVEQGTDVVAGRFQGMSPAWHQEHEEAFKLAQNEVMGHFHKCPKCSKWVDDSCWNNVSGFCVDDAQKMVTESVTTSFSAAALSPMDELKKLKELLDLGAITQEEFDQKKKSVMSKI
jgi:hypothetical protein